MDPRLKIILYGNQEEELSLLMRLSNSKLYPKNCKVISQFGDIISCRIKRKFLNQVYDSPEVKSLKAPRVIPSDDFIYEKVRRYKYKSKIAINENQTSKVVFGIVDFGFDFTHPDFINNGKTRFEKIWVQSEKK